MATGVRYESKGADMTLQEILERINTIQDQLREDNVAGALDDLNKLEDDLTVAVEQPQPMTAYSSAELGRTSMSSYASPSIVIVGWIQTLHLRRTLRICLESHLDSQVYRLTETSKCLLSKVANAVPSYQY